MKSQIPCSKYPEGLRVRFKIKSFLTDEEKQNTGWGEPEYAHLLGKIKTGVTFTAHTGKDYIRIKALDAYGYGYRSFLISYCVVQWEKVLDSYEEQEEV